MKTVSLLIKNGGTPVQNRVSSVPANELVYAMDPLPRSVRAGTCAVLVERIGPYHLSRLNAVARRMPTCALEFFGMDSTYAWDRVSDTADFERLTLLDEAKHRGCRDRSLTARVFKTLNLVAPDVVAIPGWSSKGALAGLKWCLKTGTPAVVLSASSEVGKERAGWKEAVKRRVVRLFSAGVGGGTPQAAYLTRLGIPRENVFLGYDVVDNSYFAERAEAARQDAARLRRSLGLPEKYFLCICRFVAEKNLPTLLESYAAYRRQSGTAAWKLVLVGDGPLKSQLLQQREQLGLVDDVLLPGFKQYHELPTFYGLARAFVLPSLSETWGLVVNEAMAAGLPVIVSNYCGCAADLVDEGRNGFTFAPHDTSRLTSIFAKLTHPTTNVAAMGQSSREIIARWTPDTFASSLQRAVESAHAATRPTPSAFDQLLLRLLLRR